MNIFLKIGFSDRVPYGQGCVTQIWKYGKDKLVLSLWAFLHIEIFNIQSSHSDPFYQCHFHWKSITELPRSTILESLRVGGIARKIFCFKWTFMIKGGKEWKDVRIGESGLLTLYTIAKHLYAKDINLFRWHTDQISRQWTGYYFHRFGVARLANKNIRCPVKFEFEINSELFLV